MNQPMRIGRHDIGPGHPAYIIAEMSANHDGDIGRAIEIIHAAKAAGADAIKMQTYTPDTITIDSDRPEFQIGKGSLWAGKNLYRLYGEAYTPWDWQPRLKQVADELGLDCFSTPFDPTAVEFLEAMNVPAHKIASFEIVDIPLVRQIARTGKPIIMSTGMATLAEIDEAVAAIRSEGNHQLALLKCTSAYPAPPEEANLRTIPHLAQAFGVPAGLSDHTLGMAVPVAAVALGACIIEKHFTLSRAGNGPDDAFSLEPQEFQAMVAAIRTAEKALGTVRYTLTERESASRIFRRSLYVVASMAAGEPFTEANVRSIRPSCGLPCRELPRILGRRAAVAIPKGTPLSWELIG